ncbi:alpha/beta hydrolase fold domain-containing protein [Winogradskyella helgolandensis]|uniref:alpha/beta hydrolase fold domain-containing protein n=1 Tax=Winogradskyella helgolandensis TaxID=2697010 RepID=UPI0015BEBE39|nr:alpha/beta hydrolase fold domain-containing protein [Winogradskyella helgolandensis]
MTRFRKFNFNVSLVILGITFPFLQVFAQSEDQSNGAYRDVYINKTWERLDVNKDGQFTEEDNKRLWKNLNELLDSNGDALISFEEFSAKKQVPYLKTEGKRKLNVLFKVTEEEDLYLDIYYPKTSKEGEKLPVVIYTHGGGWTQGSRHGAANASFKTVHTALLEKGFCVVSVSYRLWKKDGNTTMRDCVIDSKDAMRYLSKHSETLGIDANRFFSFGDSAGGHISQMLLLSAPETLKGDPDLASYNYNMVAGVSWYGPCDFEDISLFNHDDSPNFKDRFGARITKPDTKPKDKLALYKEMSPINYLEKNSAPLLMIQGDKDTTIPVKHAYYMAEKANEVGAPVTTLIVKNAGHNWRRVGADINPTRESIIKTTIDYFNSYLK